ncbi:MAG: type II toxin-antitoxin system Phd/YefM family antitoxin [Chloroflexota bacterium]|nr:type II toxin-antitoxin system Phd/YefM family antitoxin [Chloroflexota bacterium]
MDNPDQVKEASASYSMPVTDLSHPIILERDGQPVAVLMGIEEYERYQALLEEHQGVSALKARRAADRAVFGDLVGCALSSGDPEWAPAPEPRWRVPYRSFDGTLLAVVEVDARTRAVSLTDEERTALLEQVERLVTANDVSA